MDVKLVSCSLCCSVYDCLLSPPALENLCSSWSQHTAPECWLPIAHTQRKDHKASQSCRCQGSFQTKSNLINCKIFHVLQVKSIFQNQLSFLRL